MAVASVVVTVTRAIPLAGAGMLVFGTLAIDASTDTYATGGLTLGAEEFGAKVPTCPGAAEWMDVKGISGYQYEYNNSLLLIKGAKSSASDYDPLKELSTGAIPSGVSGDTINFLALFSKLG